MNKKSTINELYQNWIKFANDFPKQANTMSNLLYTVSSDIYSESQRFIFELIQNADDAAITVDNEIHFSFYPNHLIVSHKGKSFDKDDINAICDVGEGTKASDESKTGYKGIGFKSVFGKSDKVSVFSGGFNFRFDRKFINQSFNGAKMPWQIIPIWTNENELPKSAKSIVSNGYNVSTVIELKNTNGLQNDLNELLSNGKILLFLRKITKISVSINGEHNFTIEKSIINKEEYFDEVSLLKNDKETTQWIVTTFDSIPIDNETQTSLKQDEKTPPKLKEAKFTEISFAAKIENKRIKALKGEESLIFTYLPTKVIDFEFPFLVNGNFLTTTNRQEIHTDRIWNQSLFRLIAEKSFKWLELIAKTKYKYQVLTLLPCKQNSSQNRLKISFYKNFDRIGHKSRFILTKANNLKTPDEILVDRTELSELTFIKPSTLIKYINDEKQTNFKDDSFIHKNINQSEKLRAIGVTFFEINNLEDFFISDIFKEAHNLDDNYSLIEFFYYQSSNGSNLEWNERLKSIPFIYSKGKKLKSPESLCFPSINFKTEFGDKVTVIHSKVYPQIEKNERIKIWLEKLGVKEPSDIAYLENEILPNLEKLIGKNNYKKITRYIFNLHKRNELEHFHYQKLGGLKLLCKDKVFYCAADCFLSDFYLPELFLEKLYSDNHYVSDAYIESHDKTIDWKSFFIKVGVSETISVFSIERQSEYDLTNIFNCNRDYFWEYSGPQHYTSWNYDEYSLTKISFIEKANKYPFSKVFWRTLLKSNISIIEAIKDSRGFWGSGDMGGARRGDQLKSYVEWLIFNIPIIPTTTQKCRLPSEVFLNDKDNLQIAGKYLPVFDYDEPIQEDWKEFLQLKENFELRDYLNILEYIKKDSENNKEIRKSNIKRIGQIYNKIAYDISNFSSEKKYEITEWATTNKLLSTSGKFEIGNKLKWINIDGFTSSSEKLQLIQLPENCETQYKYFEEFISLFQVQIIDKFTPTYGKKKKDFDLKNKLQNILPYLVAIIEKKQYTDFSEEFERLFSVVTKTEFFNTAEIKLSFKYQTEIIEGASLNVFRKLNKFYFKGRWRSPTTMFTLIPELSGLLEVTGQNDELRLLLQLDEVEIIEWLTGLGYDIYNIKTKPEYKKAKQKIKIEATGKNATIIPTQNEVLEPEEEYGEFLEIPQPENFEPEVRAQDIEVSNIKPRWKKSVRNNSEEQPQYQEITDDDVRFAIGRWSEEFVFNNLIKWGNYTEIIWENEVEESGKPFDFKVVENGKEKFIEVKGTPSAKKDLIYLSSNEWNLMFEQKDNYILIRIYNAGKTNVFPEIIENPSQQIEQGSIQVALRV